MLRRNYSSKLKQLMQEASVSTEIRTAVDLGCSTGLSTLELHSAFPDAQITAVDMSPYFIAVANHDQQQRQVCAEQSCLACFLVQPLSMINWWLTPPLLCFCNAPAAASSNHVLLA